MSIKQSLLNVIKMSERISSSIYLSIKSEKPALLTFLMHSLFKDQAEIDKDLVDPFEAITVEQFRYIIDYYQSHDYQFVSPTDVISGLQSENKYIMLTFDDGYFNNSRAIPILEEFNIPATFFISSGYIKNNRSYWWDIFYRYARAKGKSYLELNYEGEKFKNKMTLDIEKDIVNLVGKENLKPISDTDRPFTPSELKDFSSNKYVHIGNHTVDHAILTNYNAEQIHYQINQAQDDLYEITGTIPETISYPNGNFSQVVVDTAEKIGLKLGVTVVPAKNYFPFDEESQAILKLGRFILYGNKNLRRLCELYRSDILFYDRLKRIMTKEANY